MLGHTLLVTVAASPALRADPSAGRAGAPPTGPRAALSGYVEANYAYNQNRPAND